MHRQAVSGVGIGSGFVGLRALFDRHVLEFTGLKDIATFQTLDVFGVLVAADNLHARVLTLIHDPSLLGVWRRRLAS
jgi:hypothetical protein